MNQEQDDSVSTYLGLQGFKVVALERVPHPQRGQVKVVRVERRDGQHECPQCGRRHGAGGRVYFTIVTNLESGCVVWIGDGKGRKGLLPFLWALRAKGRRKLRGVVSDPGYQSIIARRLPRAVQVLDRFHIVQWVNEALNLIRRRLFSGAPRDGLGRTLKAKKWMSLSARENLEHKNKLLLNGLLQLNQPLYTASLLKEQLRGVLRYPWKRIGVLRDRLHDWILAVLGAGLPELRRVAHRLAHHLDAENVLDRRFTAKATNQAWVTDITYVPTGEGWLSVAAIIDLFSRRVVGLAMSGCIDRKLALDAARAGDATSTARRRALAPLGSG